MVYEIVKKAHYNFLKSKLIFSSDPSENAVGNSPMRT